MAYSTWLQPRYCFLIDSTLQCLQLSPSGTNFDLKREGSSITIDTEKAVSDAFWIVQMTAGT